MRRKLISFTDMNIIFDFFRTLVLAAFKSRSRDLARDSLRCFGSRKIKKGGISPILLICISAVAGIAAYGL